jgi:hypothetical protein
VAAPLQDCLLDEGINNEEESSFSDDAPRDEYTNTGVEHGQDDSPDRTNEIHNIAKSNIQMVGAFMTQLSRKAGIKQWGKVARDA